MADEKNPAPAAPAAAPVTEGTPAPAASPVDASTSASPSPALQPSQPENALGEQTVLGLEEPKPEAKPEGDVKPEATPEKTTPETKPAEKPAEQKTAEGADKKPTEAEKKEEVSQSDEPAPLPSFDAWKFPEGVTAEEAAVSEFNKMLGEFSVTNKVEQKLVQEFGQKLIDRHVTEVQSAVQRLADAYAKVWKDQTKGWYDDFVKDPEIGGKRQETTVKAARDFIRRHGGTDEQQSEIRTLMQKTGVGNHPALIRLFAKANTAMAEGKPLPAGKPPAQPSTRTQKFYGKK